MIFDMKDRTSNPFSMPNLFDWRKVSSGGCAVRKNNVIFYLFVGLYSLGDYCKICTRFMAIDNSRLQIFIYFAESERNILYNRLVAADTFLKPHRELLYW